MKSTYHRLYRNTIRLITNATTVSRARDDFGRLQCEAQGVEWRGQVGTVPLPVTAEDYIETRRWVKQAYQRQGKHKKFAANATREWWNEQKEQERRRLGLSWAGIP